MKRISIILLIILAFISISFIKPPKSLNGNWKLYDAEFYDTENALLLLAGILNNNEIIFQFDSNSVCTIKSDKNTIIEKQFYQYKDGLLIFNTQSKEKIKIVPNFISDSEMVLTFSDSSWLLLRKMKNIE